MSDSEKPESTARPSRKIKNPFPGPQPYRAADRERFFGRDALVKKLANQLLAHRVTTLFGPSGAGKSSLMQAGVIPRLIETHDFRVVRVDSWPPNEAPIAWLVSAVYADLKLGPPPQGKSADDALNEAMVLAERRSEQPILIYLDQIEQVLAPDRPEAEALALMGGVDRLAQADVQSLQIALSLREDYLGRFRDRARDRADLLAHGFRLGPLTVGEMVKAVCKAAALGEPPQHWDDAELRSLMLEVRTPGEAATDAAEVQAAYAQIVCRALFQQRSQQDGGAGTAIEAEPILRRYLDATIEDLGPLGPEAQRLLEDHLVTIDGSRTLRTEKELGRIVAADKLAPILRALEAAAILHAEAHQGSRYFEIGHDWLARRVFEQRRTREEEDARKKREAEQEAKLRTERAEAAARLAHERSRRRIYMIIAFVSLALATGAAAGGVWAVRKKREADELRKAANDATDRAEVKAVEASNARLLAGFRELKNSGQLWWATKLLPEVQRPNEVRGWVPLASDALSSNALLVTLRGHDRGINDAVWSPDGKRVLTASSDGTARIWTSDAAGDPYVLRAHKGAVLAAAWSADGTLAITGSNDSTACVWNTERGELVRTLAGHTGAVVAVSLSKDGKRALTASKDGTARLWDVSDGSSVALEGHKGPLTAAVFHPDGDRALTASEDGTARVWSLNNPKKPLKILKDHKAEITALVLSPGGRRVITTSNDGTARIWDLAGDAKAVVLDAHRGSVLAAAWSADGKRVATASADRTARVWSVDGKAESILFSGHALAVTAVAFSPDGRYIVTGSRDQTARVWPSEGGTPLVLSGHQGPISAAIWAPDGLRVLTAASDDTERSLDSTAKIWRSLRLESLPRDRPHVFHSAFLNADGDLVASAYDDQKARVWRVDGSRAPVDFDGHQAWITSAAFSPDGTRIVTSSLDGTAHLTRVDGVGDTLILSGHQGPVRAAAVSPDGARVVTASDDKTALIHWVDGREKPTILAGHADGLTWAAFSADGSHIVTASMDHTARVWPADGKGESIPLKGHGGPVFRAVFSPDGKRIVTASDDGYADEWSAETGARIASLPHGSPVLAVAWSPDGKRIATSSVDEGVRLWTEGSADPITFDSASPVIALAFSDQGRKIVTVSEDNTTRTLTIDVDALKTGLEAANADCLSPAMRALYLGEPADKARDGYAQCEGSHKRTPARTEGKQP